MAAGGVDHPSRASAERDKPGSSRLCLTGRDLSAVMDRMDVVMSYPGCSDSVIAAAILVPLRPYGVVPQVSPTVDVPLPTERVPLQHETDLRFVFGGWRDNNYGCFSSSRLVLAQAAPISPDFALRCLCRHCASTWGRAAMSMR